MTLDEVVKLWGPPGGIVTCLLIALRWLYQRMLATEEKLEACRLECQKRLTEERLLRENLETQHSKALLAACAKMGQSAQFLAGNIRDLRDEIRKRAS